MLKLLTSALSRVIPGRTFKAVGEHFAAERGYALSLPRSYKRIVLRGCTFDGGLEIEARHGAVIEVVDCTFRNLRFRGLPAGHAILLNGLAGSKPRRTVVRLTIADCRIECGERSCIEDAVNLCSVQGRPTAPMVLRNVIVTGHVVNGSGAETALCVDRFVQWLDVTACTFDVVSGNVIVNCAGGSHVRFYGNLLAGSCAGSAMNAYNHYGEFGDQVCDVTFPLKGPERNVVTARCDGAAWIDMGEVPEGAEG